MINVGIIFTVLKCDHHHRVNINIIIIHIRCHQPGSHHEDGAVRKAHLDVVAEQQENYSLCDQRI